MIKPIFDNVILKKFEEEEKTQNGIIVSFQKNSQVNIGEVFAIGEASVLSVENGGELKIGDKVIFSDNFKEVDYKNEKYYVLNEEELLAIIE
ncbi:MULTISPECIES: co-chaperone GroES [unclassified Gemella]|uniref:GroES family chaperonin n=1 Tax=unclassified Gemella TaxID=2624949 RepID=UPI001C042B38|nr:MULTISPECIES: co-chaperone GroES [unclassified Gemella]MBU0278491.1 co-chaperone GroES [Gemella sp. zg-1178]QWQ39469.1 co-chaperone GroES [Gemella sp. zg-570]